MRNPNKSVLSFHRGWVCHQSLGKTFVQLNVFINGLGKKEEHTPSLLIVLGYAMSHYEDQLSQTAEGPHQPVLTRW